MYSEQNAVKIENAGKMYKLYKNPRDKIKDAFGLNFYKKNYYKEFWALRGINITIKKGERVGLIGHNGAGKSTLLKCIIGNIQLTEGNIKVNGIIQALLELGTGFHPEFTGKENIRASLAYQGLTSKKIDTLEDEIIDFTELGEYIEQPVRTYSAGMYSRLAFATATAVCPELLIIDEVLGAGDAYFMGKCVERMRKLTSEEGTTVLFVSHDLQSVQALCDRVIWIDKGNVRYDGEVLKGIKLYTQSVRKNEELRLRIRDMKISKNQAVLLDRKQDLYNEMLFRFVSDEKVKETVNKIYSLELLADDNIVASIDVGAPMDNNPEQNNYIMDEIGVTCWQKSQKDERGFYRKYANLAGSNMHAPFCMAVSKEYEGKKISIKYVGERVPGRKVRLQIFDVNKKEYFTIAENEQLDNNAIFLLPQLAKQQEVVEDILVDKINTEDAIISNFEIKNSLNESVQVFPYEIDIASFSFNIQFFKQLSKCIVTFLIYSIRGELVLSTCREIELENREKEINIIYSNLRGKFGPGEYTITIGIYEELDTTDNSREQKFMALVDRGFSFKVEQPQNYCLNLGLFIPELEIHATSKSGKELENQSMI